MAGKGDARKASLDEVMGRIDLDTVLGANDLSMFAIRLFGGGQLELL